jgi:hypothetical protein
VLPAQATLSGPGAFTVAAVSSWLAGDATLGPLFRQVTVVMSDTPIVRPCEISAGARVLVVTVYGSPGLDVGSGTYSVAVPPAMNAPASAQASIQLFAMPPDAGPPTFPELLSSADAGTVTLSRVDDGGLAGVFETGLTSSGGGVSALHGTFSAPVQICNN